jgi:ankyrin repeat protein
MPKALPARPHLDWLKKTAKAQLMELRAKDSTAKLHQAQRDVANAYGFKSWRTLKAHVDATSLDGRIVAAAVTGNASELSRLLTQHPGKIGITGGPWDRPLLHLAAGNGHLDCVELLVGRGYDIHRRDRVDNATALHCAAAGGYSNVVKRLVALGSDVQGDGDDHQLGVLGWATCFRQVHWEVASYLLSRGARLSIFSSVALDRGEDVRSIVRADPNELERRMSRNEHGRHPLHHAVYCDRPAMVNLLLNLGADPNAQDRTGTMPIAYAGGSTNGDEIARMIINRGGRLDMMGALMLKRFADAETLFIEDPTRLGSEGRDTVSLHVAVDRNDHQAVRWLIAHGVDINAKRSIYECNQTALHICAERGLVETAQQLLEAGADTRILDDKFTADALGWAIYCKQLEMAELIRAHRAASEPQSEPTPR